MEQYALRASPITPYVKAPEVVVVTRWILIVTRPREGRLKQN